MSSLSSRKSEYLRTITRGKTPREKDKVFGKKAETKGKTRRGRRGDMKEKKYIKEKIERAEREKKGKREEKKEKEERKEKE